ncbi:hypothetical protein Pfo_025393 [Paulownia fortunei]|nr:hypothetical protein Pfo_025393 [Paulownia fortunei]
MENEDTINGSSEAPGSEAVANQHLTCHPDGGGGQEDANAVNGNEPGEPEPSDRRKEILKALEAVERDSAAIAESFSSLFTSLRVSLSQATSSTVDHMNCFSDAAGRLQECGLIADTRVPDFAFEVFLASIADELYVDLKIAYFDYYVAVLDASTKGNRYINSCLRLNEEMKGMDVLATQLKILRRHVDALDTAVNSIVRFP